MPLRVVSNQLGFDVACNDSTAEKVIYLAKTDHNFMPPPTMATKDFENSPDGKWGVKSKRYYSPLNIALYLMDNTTKVVYEIYESNSDPVECWVDKNRLLFYGNANSDGKKTGIYLMLYDPSSKKISDIEKTNCKAATYVSEKNAIVFEKRVDGKISSDAYGKRDYYLYDLKKGTSTKITKERYDQLKKLADSNSKECVN